MGNLLPDIAGPAFDGLKRRLDLLGGTPPQVLLLDGGDGAQRAAAARYWACRCNCPDARPSPCLDCPTCRQIAEGEHLDVLAYDGRISNKEDEDSPGPVRALTVRNVRDLRRRLNEPPHGEGLRVVILDGIGRTRTEAANALLKALEEPSETTVFVLLASQREQLLPTLVSRSHCLLLPWPDPEAEEAGEARAALERDLGEFLRSGRGFMGRTAEKGFDADQARASIDVLRKALLRTMAGRAGSGAVDAALAGWPAGALENMGRWLVEAGEMVSAQVTPSRVMDALLTRLYLSRPGR